MKKNGNSKPPTLHAVPESSGATLPVRVKDEDAALVRTFGVQYEQAVHALGALALKRRSLLAQLDAEEQAILTELGKRANKVNGEVESLRVRYHLTGDGWHYDYGVGQFTRPDPAGPTAPTPPPPAPQPAAPAA